MLEIKETSTIIGNNGKSLVNYKSMTTSFWVITIGIIVYLT